MSNMTHTFKEYTPVEYLKIDIANNFSGSLDKMDFEDRIAWFDENKDDLRDLVQSASDPALFYAGVKAYEDALAGVASGYPVSLDACSSGLQLLASMVGCVSSGKLCGLVNTGHREDAYTNIYQHMCDVIGEETQITRDDCKQAIMTALYSSTAIPKQVFGEGELLEIFYNTMETLATGAWELNKSIQELWNPNAYSHDWILPDNFHVVVKVTALEGNTVNFRNAIFDVITEVNKPSKSSKSLSPNATHSVDGLVVREMVRRCSYDPEKIMRVREATSYNNKRDTEESDKMVMLLWNHYLESGFLSTRILNYLNRYNMGHVDKEVIIKLLLTLPQKPFDIMTVHDCFRCLPAYANDLRRQYNQILSDIAGSNILSFIVSQIAGRKINVQKMGDLSEYILNSNYSLS